MAERPDLMRWLATGVPLTLLIDLLDPAGPVSTRIYEAEPADASWVPPRDSAA